MERTQAVPAYHSWDYVGRVYGSDRDAFMEDLCDWVDYAYDIVCGDDGACIKDEAEAEEFAVDESVVERVSLLSVGTLIDRAVNIILFHKGWRVLFSGVRYVHPEECIDSS